MFSTILTSNRVLVRAATTTALRPDISSRSSRVVGLASEEFRRTTTLIPLIKEHALSNFAPISSSSSCQRVMQSQLNGCDCAACDLLLLIWAVSDLQESCLPYDDDRRSCSACFSDCPAYW